ncbi:hypothetical protein HXX76_013715 [Chlamydomonas incerta]|uniref:Uncharacterized protein n=1 Tax=Chlamydomonas incerta TaxID=51695 RepID=A0A835SH83_CHLIN|nr:hypothetical protein HXX76_013715 [Chlamydomonas incerta]|eukprot:KAG2425506.1 hypothetical protein HXX76_013715 [Chlamydomonas incerta]
MAAKGKQEWDFLKADANTPSSPSHYYEPLNAKKEGEFKPGWNTKRRGPAWEAERQAAIVTKEQKNTNCAALRSERLNNAQQASGFNPIAHTERAADGSWVPATNAWMHQKVGVKQQDPRAAAADTLKHQAEGASRAAAIAEMRKERIAAGGASRPAAGGGAKEALTWG